MKSATDGATPLDPDEADELVISVTTRSELNELEEANIEEAQAWAVDAALLRRRPRDVLTEAFLYELHARMFGEVWAWAGRVRNTNKNIGIDKAYVRSAVRDLIADARLWREQRIHEPDELAVRFHHRLVAIHPFPNGNGRHARLLADLLVQQAGRPEFSWGGGNLVTTEELRARYIGALRAADQGDIHPLLRFARS